MIKVKTLQDVIEIDQSCIQYFGILKEHKKSQEPVKIQIEEQILRRIDQFIRSMKGQQPSKFQKPLPSGKLSDILNDQEYQFMKTIERNQMGVFIKAAQTLNCAHLYELCKVAVAAYLISRTTSEMINELKLNYEYNDEEEKRIQNNYKDIINK
ncbi:hypothetical protein pb186bvf_006178 [Paramecium bursaria]